MSRVEFWVSGKLTNPLNHRKHWRAVATYSREWKERTQGWATVAARVNEVVAHLPKRVTFTAHVGGKWDDDNLPAAIKPIRDALIGRVIHSDAPDSGHTFVYRQVIDRARRGVLVTVEPA